MAGVPEQRPTAGDRDAVIQQLTLNYAHNHLDDAEFERRLSRATNTESPAELAELVHDLPQVADQAKGPVPADPTVAVNHGLVKEEGTLAAVLGGTSRKGVWQPPRRLRIVALLGGVDLDFTQAEMAPGTTEVTVFALMGGIDIVVPPGINVDVSGVPLMGGFDDRSQGIVDPNAPTLKVRGLALMGGVDVKLPKKLRKLAKQQRRAARRLDSEGE